jgi:carbonic anhydrase
MEFATKVACVKFVVMLIYTKSAALIGACNHLKMGNLNTLLDKVNPAIESE